jgi:hypothetical protein
MIRYVTVDHTIWPVDVETEDEDSAQWVLRYSGRQLSRMALASVLSAYAALCDPAISQRDAIEKLKRARRAHAA